MVVGRTGRWSNKPVYTGPGKRALWGNYQVSCHYCVQIIVKAVAIFSQQKLAWFPLSVTSM